MPPTYRAPVEDVAFLLRDLLDYEGEIATLPGFEDADLETVLEVLGAGGQFCSEVLAPLNGPADREGCHFEDGRVRTPAGFREAYAAFVEGGWAGLGADPAHGGAGCRTSSARPSASSWRARTSASRPTPSSPTARRSCSPGTAARSSGLAGCPRSPAER
jgi:alkylation response protein AidB-like acyl-CoA dehydrogenase